MTPNPATRVLPLALLRSVVVPPPPIKMSPFASEHPYRP